MGRKSRTIYFFMSPEDVPRIDKTRRVGLVAHDVITSAGLTQRGVFELLL